MSTGAKWAIGIAGTLFGIPILIGLWIMSNYNSMIYSRNDVGMHTGVLQTALQSQAENIPNFVETAKAMAGSENKTLREVIEARRQVSALSNISPQQLAENPELMKQLAQATAAMGAAMINVNALREQYPTLQQSKGFMMVFAELAGAQNRVRVARNRLQQSIQYYNNRIETFPRSMIASATGFKSLPYFEAEASSQRAPQVKF